MHDLAGVLTNPVEEGLLNVMSPRFQSCGDKAVVLGPLPITPAQVIPYSGYSLHTWILAGLTKLDEEC